MSESSTSGRSNDGRAFPFSTPLIFLIALTAIHTAGLCTLTAHSVIRPMEKAETLWTLVFSLILAWWVYADRGARGFQLPFEFEFFVFIAWPVAVPYYLYRRRGGPGLFLGIGVWGLYMAPYVISAFVYIARTVRGGS
jgi:hypothetical protein